MLRVKYMSISCEIALRWLPQNLTDDLSTLVQVMAWCHRATIHYLNQCWPSSTTVYGIIWPQWVDGPGLCELDTEGLSFLYNENSHIDKIWYLFC